MTQREIIETRRSILFMCLLTVKSIVIAMVIGFGLLFAVLSINPAEAATLRPTAQVADDVIRVGDIFSDTEKADLIIGKAPAPGQDMLLNARTLSRLAALHDIDWRASSVTDQVLIRRETHTVGAEEVSSAVRDALSKRDIPGDYRINLTNHAAPAILPKNIPATAEVSSLSYTPGRDVFTATVAIPSADNPVKLVNVSGTIERSVTVPVLKSALRNGDIIGTGDIEWIEVSERALSGETILDADQMIGKTPVRVVSTGTPVKLRDVTNPQLVARGDEITIIVMEGGMQLTAKGKAMQNGSEGDLIRAVNVTSNRSVTAMVTGDRTVTVR